MSGLVGLLPISVSPSEFLFGLFQLDLGMLAEDVFAETFVD